MEYKLSLFLYITLLKIITSRGAREITLMFLSNVPPKKVVAL
jgi:hypothetical protein